MAQKKSKSTNPESDTPTAKQSISKKAEKLEQKIKKLKMELDKKTSSEDKKKKVTVKKEDKKNEINIAEGDFDLTPNETQMIKEKFPNIPEIKKVRIFRTNKKT